MSCLPCTILRVQMELLYTTSFISAKNLRLIVIVTPDPSHHRRNKAQTSSHRMFPPTSRPNFGFSSCVSLLPFPAPYPSLHLTPLMLSLSSTFLMPTPTSKFVAPSTSVRSAKSCSLHTSASLGMPMPRSYSLSSYGSAKRARHPHSLRCSP